MAWSLRELPREVPRSSCGPSSPSASPNRELIEQRRGPPQSCIPGAAHRFPCAHERAALNSSRRAGGFAAAPGPDAGHRPPDLASLRALYSRGGPCSIARPARVLGFYLDERTPAPRTGAHFARRVAHRRPRAAAAAGPALVVRAQADHRYERAIRALVAHWLTIETTAAFIRSRGVGLP